MELQGMVAIVTGAGRGIGRAIALALAGQGAAVVLAARSAAELDRVAGEIGGQGGRVLAVPTDVADPAQVERLVSRTVEAFGRIDILVNNAGGSGPGVGVDELAPEQWHEVLDSNLTSAYLCTRSAVPHMKGHGGRIINVSSVAGKTGLPCRAGYCAAKAGVIGLTRSLALELGPYGIHVNCVVPGAIAGERLDKVIRMQAGLGGVSPAEVEAGMKARSPLGRLIPPEDVAAAVLWLAGPHSASITGEDLNVTAGAVMF